MDKEKQTKTKTKTKNRKTDRQTDRQEGEKSIQTPQRASHPSSHPSGMCVCMSGRAESRELHTYIHTYKPGRTSVPAYELKSNQIVAPFSSLFFYPILFFTQERHGMDTTHSKEPRALLLCF